MARIVGGLGGEPDPDQVRDRTSAPDAAVAVGAPRPTIHHREPAAGRDFCSGSMLSKKSKIEQLAKSHENRFLAASAAASLGRTCTKLCGRLLVTRCGPSPWRGPDAPAALKNLVHLPENTFSTASVTDRRRSTSAATAAFSGSSHSAPSPRCEHDVHTIGCRYWPTRPSIGRETRKTNPCKRPGSAIKRPP
jgi:hypothetical protein